MKPDFEYLWMGKKRTIFGLPLSFTTYFITEKKLITRKGFFNIEEDEIDIYRIIDKKMSLPLGQRMFGCGTITINVHDVDTPVKVIESIKNPRDVMHLLDDRIEAMRDKYNIRGRDMINREIHHHSDTLIEPEDEDDNA